MFGDTIMGTDSSDYFEEERTRYTGGDGPDIFKSGAGDDIIKGGKGGLDDMGTPGEDVAIFSRAESGYTVEFYSNKGEKKDIISRWIH